MDCLHYKSLHVLWRTGVRYAVGCDIDEYFRAGSDTDRDASNPQGEMRDTRANLAGRSLIPTRRGEVDIVLNDGI